jgi:tyrosyl-tRNA synthetase
MLERDEFLNRLKNNQPISIHEMLYPLAGLRFGGSKRCGAAAPIKVQPAGWTRAAKEYGQEPQIVLTMPILEDWRRSKMSKSLNNYIGIKAAKEMFGKVMSISDDDVSYYELY